MSSVFARTPCSGIERLRAARMSTGVVTFICLEKSHLGLHIGMEKCHFIVELGSKMHIAPTWAAHLK